MRGARLRGGGERPLPSSGRCERGLSPPPDAHRLLSKGSGDTAKLADGDRESSPHAAKWSGRALPSASLSMDSRPMVDLWTPALRRDDLTLFLLLERPAPLSLKQHYSQMGDCCAHSTALLPGPGHMADLDANPGRSGGGPHQQPEAHTECALNRRALVYPLLSEAPCGECPVFCVR